MTWDWLVYNIIYGVLVFGIPGLVIWASYSKNTVVRKFDVRELWLHQNRVDKFAVIILGTWWVHTCSMLLWTLTHSINDTNVVTYMGWALPLIAKMWAPHQDARKGGR